MLAYTKSEEMDQLSANSKRNKPESGKRKNAELLMKREKINCPHRWGAEHTSSIHPKTKSKFRVLMALRVNHKKQQSPDSRTAGG